MRALQQAARYGAAVLAAALVFFICASRQQAQAQTPPATCIPSLQGGSYNPLNVLFYYPLCPSGALDVNITGGSVSANVTFPYSVSNGQATQINSLIGLAAWNGTTMDPLRESNGVLQVGPQLPFASPAPSQSAMPSVCLALYPGAACQGTSGNPIYTSGAAASASYGMTQGQTALSLSAYGATGAYFSSAPTLTNGQVNPLSLDVSGYLNTHLQSAASGLSFGAASVNGVGAVLHTVDTVSSNNVKQICSSACTALELSVVNGTAATCYIQEFNLSSANVTLGTTVPVRVFQVAANGSAADSIPPTIGIYMNGASTPGWSYATTTALYNGTTWGTTACGTYVYANATHD
jgi:hypothetical protein